MAVLDDLAEQAYQFKTGGCMVPFEDQGEMMRVECYAHAQSVVTTIRCATIVEGWTYKDDMATLFGACISDLDLGQYVANLQDLTGFMITMQHMVRMELAKDES